MLTKLAAIVLLIGVGWFVAKPVSAGLTSSPSMPFDDGSLERGLAAAMVPVLFAYGGWQTATFVSGEMRNPRRDLPRGLFIGVAGVIIVYVLVTYVCLRVLGHLWFGEYEHACVRSDGARPRLDWRKDHRVWYCDFDCRFS
jgi:APA family basic amino acid/polyamine antiporter